MPRHRWSQRGSVRPGTGAYPMWYGRYRTYDTKGKSKERRVPLGLVSETTEAEAIAKLRAIIDAERRQSDGLGEIGLVDCLPSGARLRRQEKLRSTQDTGAVSELLVCMDLLLKRFEVFKAVSAGASCDLLAMKNGNTVRIEVKTGEMRSTGRARVAIERNIGKFDVLAVVTREGKIHYQMHTLLDSTTQPRIVDAETAQSLRSQCGITQNLELENGPQVTVAQ